MLPVGEFTGDAVAKVTENMTKLNSEDLKDIAFQLKSAPAIPNKVTKK